MTDASGHAVINCGPVAAGTTHCLVVYRDPKDVPAGKAAPVVNATARAYTTPADLEPTTPAGWAYALVPRPVADGTPTYVPAPTALYGDSAATYFNWAQKNSGASTSVATRTRLYADGVAHTTWNVSELIPGRVITTNYTTARTLPAGRHALTMRVDANGQAAEISELNNEFGLQWVWRPKPLALRTPVVRAAPGDPTGGWEEILAGGQTVTFYNCDGVRLPPPSFSGPHGYWQAVAVMPGAASDVDPRLHEANNGVAQGFRLTRAVSAWGVGQSDYVLANFRATSPARAFDVGVVRAVGTENYTAEALASTYRAYHPDGTYGPYTLAAGHIMQLHELTLEPGPIAIGLIEDSGDIDWGLTLHRGDLPYQGKSDAVNGEISWFRGPGWGEWLVLDIPFDGYYCLAVWKVKSVDLAKDGGYRLKFVPGLTDVPEVPSAPVATTLVSIRPNPFNPCTSIVFDVARAGNVRLLVYDLLGRRVRTLLDEVRRAGRFACTWEGTDDRGQPAASGVYLVRLVTAGGSDRRAVTLLK